MPTANHLKQAFPIDWSEIQKARGHDVLLDEICKDFESLSLDVERAGKKPGVMSEGLKADYVKIMDALKDEITNWLASSKLDCRQK